MLISDKEGFKINLDLIDPIPLLGVLLPAFYQLEHPIHSSSNQIIIPKVIQRNGKIYPDIQSLNIKDFILEKHLFYNRIYTTLDNESNTVLPIVETLIAPYYKNGETWCIAFAPNNSYIAWSAGLQRVYLIPVYLLENSDLTPQNVIHNHWPKNKNTRPGTQIVTLDCGHTIWSMAFGSAHHPKRNRSAFIERGTATAPGSAATGAGAGNVVNKRFHFEAEDIIFATGLGNGQIKIWQVPTGQLLTILFDHTEPVRSLEFAPDLSLRLLSGSLDRTLKIWDMADDGNMSHTINVSASQTRVKATAWSPDATLIVSVGGSNKAHVWDSKSLRLLRKLVGHLHEVVDCDFSPDGALVVTASYDTCAILWDPYTATAIRKFGHLFPPPRPIFASGPNNHYVRSVSFSPDGRHFASVAEDGYLRMWDISRQAEVPCKIGWNDFPLCCKFSAKSTFLASSDKFGRLMLWRFRSNCALTTKCSTCCFTPNRLDHLCRMTIRTIVPDTNIIDNIFGNILPRKLVTFIKYRTLIKDFDNGDNGHIDVKDDGTFDYQLISTF